MQYNHIMKLSFRLEIGRKYGLVTVAYTNEDC